MSGRTCLILAALAGFTAVAAGTFGAHGLEGRVEDEQLATFEIGARYHAYHALALLAMAGLVERLGRAGAVAGWAFTVGIVIFAGSLYLLAVTGQRWLGAITPIGGASFLLGWAALLIGAVRLTKSTYSANVTR